MLDVWAPTEESTLPYGWPAFVPRAVRRSSAARKAPPVRRIWSDEPATGGEPRARASRFLSRRQGSVQGTDDAGASFGMTVRGAWPDVPPRSGPKSAMNPEKRARREVRSPRYALFLCFRALPQPFVTHIAWLR